MSQNKENMNILLSNLSTLPTTTTMSIQQQQQQQKHQESIVKLLKIYTPPINNNNQNYKTNARLYQEIVEHVEE